MMGNDIIQSNGSGIGSNNSLMTSMTKEEAQYAGILEAQKEMQNGVKNTFVYTPERVSPAITSAVAAVQGDGLFVPTTPDQIRFSHQLTSPENRRLGELAGFTFDVGCSFQIGNGNFIDSSVSNITTNVYFLMGYVPYSRNGAFPDPSMSFSSSLFYAMMQINLGTLNWIKADRQFLFQPASISVNLLDFIPERPPGSFFPRDFTENPDRIARSDFELLTSTDLMLAMGIVIQAQSNFNNTAFLIDSNPNSGSPLLGFRVSYSFNYYALLANF